MFITNGVVCPGIFRQIDSDGNGGGLQAHTYVVTVVMFDFIFYVCEWEKTIKKYYRANMLCMK